MTIQRLLIFMTSLIFASALAAMFTPSLSLTLILGIGNAFLMWKVAMYWKHERLGGHDGEEK